MTKKCFILLAVLLLCVPVQLLAAQQDGFSISMPDKIRPYEPNTVSFQLPVEGEVVFYARQGLETKRLSDSLSFPAGRNEWIFWGLSALGEPLFKGNAVLVMQFTDAEGIRTAQADFRVLAPAPGLLYALLSQDVLSVAGKDDVYIDHQPSRAGNLNIRLFHADEPDKPLRSWTLERKDALPRAFRWDKTIGGKPAAPGHYLWVLQMQGSRQPSIKLPFTLTESEEPDIALSQMPSHAFLPVSMKDEDVWTAITAPVAVMDIGALQHQYVYEEPNSKSQTLGMIHGQTAGMQVLADDVQGYAKVKVARHGDGQWIIGFVPGNKVKIIRANQRYGLVLDKKRQNITLYEYGQKKGTLSTSTGIYVPPGESSFETLPGAYLTQDRIAEFPHSGYRFPYAVRIDGGNLLHSTGYLMVDGVPNYEDHQTELGKKASHGCVRVDNREQNGLNAWWLYANLPRNTKVLVLPENFEETIQHQQGTQQDLPASAQNMVQLENNAKPADPDQEPFQPEQTALPSISASPFLVVADEEDMDESALFNDDFAPAQAADTLQPAVGSSDVTITLSFGGDCVLGSEEHSRKQPDSFHSAVQQQGFSWPFSKLQSVFDQDDITLVNLENVLINSARSQVQRLHNFRGPTSFVEILKEGSIEVVNLANNHFNDYGQEGKNSTRQALRDAGIAYAGQSSLYIFEKEGIRIGFAGIRETVFHQGRGRIADEIEQLQEAGCHYIVYSCHFGEEYAERHNQLQTLMAQTAIDAGANLVIGHHPHVVQGIEAYKNGLIFYSLGNLVFGGNLSLSTFDGLIVQVQLDFRDEILVQTRVRLLPVLTSGSMPENDFRPLLAFGEDKARIMERIHQDSPEEYPEEFIFTPSMGEP